MDPTLWTQMLLSLSLAASPLAPAPHPVWDALTADEAAALRALDDGALDGQRAGAAEATSPLSEAERVALAEAAAEDRALEEQRGGDVHLSDRDVQVILWTAVIVAALIIIL